MSYNSYHTDIKLLAKRQKLPQKYSQNIDRSTIWRWSKEPDNKYLGQDLSKIEVLSNFLQRKEADRVIRAYLQVASVISKILSGSKLIQKEISMQKDLFVKRLIGLREDINLKLILKLCKITPTVFYAWKKQVQYNCRSSPIHFCRKLFPNQLTENETSRIKELLSDQEFKYWPINSIAYYAQWNNLIHASLATWYNYAKSLNITRKKIKKQKYGPGIRAFKPHEIWHADITIVKCLNGMKYYVYILMDNYSRFILDYRIADKVSARIRLNSIRDAYNKYIHGTENQIELIVDGGSENNNIDVESFIASNKGRLKKFIAGKDIRFSNSMVEAQNKLFKYNYLFKATYEDGYQLRKLFAYSVNDFHFKRPHHSLKGLTPHEALSGISLPDERMKQLNEAARRARIEENRKNLCGIC